MHKMDMGIIILRLLAVTSYLKISNFGKKSDHICSFSLAGGRNSKKKLHGTGHKERKRKAFPGNFRVELLTMKTPIKDALYSSGSCLS